MDADGIGGADFKSETVLAMSDCVACDERGMDWILGVVCSRRLDSPLRSIGPHVLSLFCWGDETDCGLYHSRIWARTLRIRARGGDSHEHRASADPLVKLALHRSI